MRPLWIAFGALLTVPLGVTAVHAHHSFAASFTDERIMREGVVERYVFKNPHVLLYIAESARDHSSAWLRLTAGYRFVPLPCSCWRRIRYEPLTSVTTTSFSLTSLDSKLSCRLSISRIRLD